MKVNKKMLTMLALNILAVMPAIAGESKTDRLYNNIVKNIQTGKSNNSNYKLIENILKQKNKDLKDLYLQGNYVEKPEYLEWQIFFSGFYEEYNNGKDNTGENAEYNSKTSGYYDANGNYVLTEHSVNGIPVKPYAEAQDGKYINLGINIQVKEVVKDVLTLNPSPVVPVNLALSIGNVSVPVIGSIAPVNVPQFSITQPNINITTPAGINIVIPSLSAYTNWTSITGAQWANNTQYGNVNLTSPSYKTSDGINAIAQYTISGDYYADSDTIMYVDVSQTRAVTVDLTEDLGKPSSNVYTTFTNYGKIYLTALSTAGLEIQSDNRGEHPTLKNSGLIEGQNKTQVGMIFTPEGSTDINATYIMENTSSGQIIMGGNDSSGMAVNKMGARPLFLINALNTGLIETRGLNNYGIALDLNNLNSASSILNKGIINVKGDKSGGIVLKGSIGNTDDNVVNKGNINVTSSTSFGIYSNVSDTKYVNEGNIDLTSAANSIGLRNEGGLLKNGSNGIINLTNGTNNIGLYSTDGTTENNGKIIISNGTDNIGIYAKGSGTSVVNSGEINAVSSGKIKGIAVTDNADITNTKDIKLNGQSGSVGIYASNYGTFTSSGTGDVDIKVSGTDSVGIYSENNGLVAVNGNIEAADNAINLYASNGKILLTDAALTTKANSLLFYMTNNGKFSLTNTQADIENSGAAFYYDASSLGAITSGIMSGYISNMFLSGSNSVLNMSQDSILVSVNNAAVNLSNLPDLRTTLGSVGINVSGTGYKSYLLYKSNLTVDQNANLDTEILGTVGLSATGVVNNSEITGTLADKKAIAVENEDLSAKSAVTITNNNSIILSGNNSMGIYTNYGIINNSSGKIIKLTGDNSVGLYATNGTSVQNSGDIYINGAGIYATSYKADGVSQTFGDGKTSIVNSGTVTSGSKANSVGIYSRNNSGGTVSSNDFTLDLSSGEINMTGSSGGTAVYAEKTKVTDSGSTISVGEKGIALYAKDSDVTLNGSVINLLGDNAIGFYLEGGTAFNGTGTINIDGKNIILMIPGASTTVSNNFTVGTVTSGSTYTLNAMVDSIYTYTGTAALESNGTLINGVRTAAYIGNPGGVYANPGAENIGAIVLNGQYTAGGTLPAGMSAGVDGENAGTVILGNASAGLYGTNGTRLGNTGTIQVNDNSGAIITSGSGSLGQNSGFISIGANSQAIYVKNGDTVNNMAFGSIESAGQKAVGLFADTVNTVVNDGYINMTGANSMGIYTAGANSTSITNNGAVIIGASSDPDNPSIGIYSSSSSVINNNGSIASGENSVGIYSNNGTVNQNGALNVGTNGIGLYLSGGAANITSNASFSLGTNAAGVYAENAGISNASNMSVNNNSYGFVLTNSAFSNTANNVSLGTNSVFVYAGGGTNINNGNIIMNGSDNIAFYTFDGARAENYGTITGTAETANVGIYNKGGSVLNDVSGVISVGDSILANEEYAVGIYGVNSAISNSGTIYAGSGAVGIAAEGGRAENTGNITAVGTQSIGMYTEGGIIVNETGGLITVSGKDAIGMAGKGSGSQIINNGIINVTGNNSKGIYGVEGATVINNGKIYAAGSNAAGIVLDSKSTLVVSGTGEIITNSIAAGNSYREMTAYDTPEIINSGVIQVLEKFETDGLKVTIKVDPSSMTMPETSVVSSGGYDNVDMDAEYLISNAVKIKAPSFSISNAMEITADYALGTNLNKYKLEDVLVSGSNVAANSSDIAVKSRSLTWEATPVTNSKGNIDIWMTRISYSKFTDGLWYEDFGRTLDEKYTSAGNDDALKIYDKIDLIENEADFRHVMGSMAGSIYANINQREEDITGAFENTLQLLQNSENNTKENVKLGVIAGKGKNKEETDGVAGYDYTTTGILALREVERTYKHTFGYSLGYTHTGFEFQDGNESEEWVDTIQLGVHNKYKTNGWALRNDFTGRASIHNTDRNIDWPSPNNRSEMNGTYETYSVTSDNILGKEIELSKNVSLMPYGAFRLMYVTRPSFSESGLEALEIEGNDVWSVKPGAGLELNGKVSLGRNWQLKGTLDFLYEYELADMNVREKAKLNAIEDGYHKLSKPQDENGIFSTKAAVGLEAADRYGIFLTGEYKTGNNSKNDYRTGVVLKAVF